jgi:hypothetical protein
MFCVVAVVDVHILYCDSGRRGKKLEITVLTYARTCRKEADVFIRLVLRSEQSKLLICVRIASCCCLCTFTALQIECAPDSLPNPIVIFVCAVCLPFKNSVKCWYHIASEMSESVVTRHW